MPAGDSSAFAFQVKQFTLKMNSLQASDAPNEQSFGKCLKTLMTKPHREGSF